MKTVVAEPAIPGQAAMPASDWPAEPSRRLESPPGVDLGLGVFALLNAVLRRWRLFVALPVVIAVTAAGVSLIIPPVYEATAIFVPEAGGQSSKLPSGLGALAGQFGISFGGDGTRSAEFYAEIGESRDIVQRVLLTRYPNDRTEVPNDSATLLDLIRLDGDSATRVERAVALLRNATQYEVDVQTSLVKVSVRDRSPALAAAVANRFVTVLDAFNTESRQSQAGRRREFIEQRVEEARAELRAAERALDVFHLQNRSFSQAPQLASEEGRLRRAVELRQEVFLTLSRELETARIEQVNDAPVISIIQRATPPKYRVHPRRTLLVLLAGVFGVLLAACWTAGSELTRRMGATGSPAFLEFRERLRSMWPRRRQHRDRATVHHR